MNGCESYVLVIKPNNVRSIIILASELKTFSASHNLVSDVPQRYQILKEQKLKNRWA